LIPKQAARASYVTLIVLQTAWHAVLPAPAGNDSWLLAGTATLPLLLPALGVWRGSLRSMTWAGYLVMLYFVIGVMEAWANPAQRLPALLQVLLVAVFVGSVLVYSRNRVAS